MLNNNQLKYLCFFLCVLTSACTGPITDLIGKHSPLEPPQRIVSASPMITEVVYALGIEDRLVGRTNFCRYPKQVQSVPSIGNIKDPSIETIIGLKPDLMITSTHFEESTSDKLKSLGIRVERVFNQNTIEGAYTTIRAVGKLAGVEQRADSLIEAMMARKEKILKDLKQRVQKPKVYYVVGFGKNGDFTAGSDTFIHQMIELVGGQNIAGHTTGWRYNLESLVAQNPDIIIIRKGWKEAFCSQKPYSGLKAVANKKVYEVDHHLFELNGPRIMDALNEMSAIINAN